MLARMPISNLPVRHHTNQIRVVHKLNQYHFFHLFFQQSNDNFQELR